MTWPGQILNFQLTECFGFFLATFGAPVRNNTQSLWILLLVGTWLSCATLLLLPHTASLGRFHYCVYKSSLFWRRAGAFFLCSCRVDRLLPNTRKKKSESRAKKVCGFLAEMAADWKWEETGRRLDDSVAGIDHRWRPPIRNCSHSARPDSRAWLTFWCQLLSCTNRYIDTWTQRHFRPQDEWTVIYY